MSRLAFLEKRYAESLVIADEPTQLSLNLAEAWQSLLQQEVVRARIRAALPTRTD